MDRQKTYVFCLRCNTQHTNDESSTISVSYAVFLATTLGELALLLKLGRVPSSRWFRCNPESYSDRRELLDGSLQFVSDSLQELFPLFSHFVVVDPTLRVQLGEKALLGEVRECTVPLSL